MAQVDFNNMACPMPLNNYERVLLGHGSGGKLSNDLIQRLFVPGFGGETPAALEDQAIVALNGHAQSNASQLAITTDSFVVRPIFFPGGDIGKLAVHGTVNDLAVGGATPLFLSAAFILEEGLAMEDLSRIVVSMREACEEAGVTLVTGDTKVVDKGKGDQIFITTTGVGIAPGDHAHADPDRSEGTDSRPGVHRPLSIQNARPGDRVIASGTIGDHGIAIMSVREGLEFETPLESDTAALNGLTRAMLEAVPVGGVRCMRDPTRGGVSSTLNELAQASRVGVELDEAAVPLREEVHAACEMLGLDPLYVANEGKLIAVAPADEAERLLDVMRGHPLGRDAAIIGEITDDHPGMVIQRSLIGGERVVTMLAGEQLPRIC